MFELIFQKEYQPRYLLPNPILDRLAAQSVIIFFLVLMKTALLWLKMQQNASWAASFSCSFPFSFPHLFSQPHSFLTCACLCPCVLRPGIKRNTVWTQPMPSKFLAASWLHGMEYFKLSATNKTHTSEYLLWICLRFEYVYVYNAWLQPGYMIITLWYVSVWWAMTVWTNPIVWAAFSTIAVGKDSELIFALIFFFFRVTLDHTTGNGAKAACLLFNQSRIRCIIRPLTECVHWMSDRVLTHESREPR